MKDFEKVCSEEEKDVTYETECENCIEWIRNSDRATVTFCQGRYITKIEKLAKKFPEDVQIVARNKSSIVAHIPVSFIKINNTKRELSEEERQMLSERAKHSFKHVLNKEETD